MKDVKRIISIRDKLLNQIQLLEEARQKIKQGRNFIELSDKEQNEEYKIYDLITRYRDQIKGINFCLNEDAKIDTYEKHPKYCNINHLLLTEEDLKD